MPKLLLKKNEERRILLGHQWIFSNEIEKTEGEAENGGIADIYTSHNTFIARGFYNKNSLIAFRKLSGRQESINTEFFRKRIAEANNFRLKIKPERNVYRMVNSESDFLPGLVIDRFGDKFSIQVFSLGMENFLNDIKNILISDYDAKYIVEKNDNELRVLEGLERKENILYDTENIGDGSFEAEIDGIKYNINLVKGQKTGFYLDQSENRLSLNKYVKEGDRVLDLFCNEGGFAITAASKNPSDITAVDSSEHSIITALSNAALNSIGSIKFIREDVFKFLETAKDKYDIIILDPPSFTKSKKNIQPAIKGYIELNTECMKLLNPGGLLFTYSCSHHISTSAFEEIVVKSGANSKRQIQVVESMNCSYDHPVLPVMNETKYLTGLVVRVL